MNSDSAPVRSGVKIYVGAVAIAALSIGAAIFHSFPLPRAIDVFFFWLLHALAHAKSVQVSVTGSLYAPGPNVRRPILSSGFLVMMVAAIACIPPVVIIVGMLIPLTPGGRRGSVRNIFNASQHALYGGVASLVFHVIAHVGSFAVWRTVLAATSAFLVAVSLNTGLVAGALAVEQRMKFLGIFRRMFWPTVPSLAAVLLALPVSGLYQSVGPLSALFILFPLLALRQTRGATLDFAAARGRTLRALARAVELKDPYTHRHSESVASICVALHRALGTPERELEDRYIAALLHDLGKVAIPGAVLAKPARLTAKEFGIVKAHPVVGANVALEVGVLRKYVPEILLHHERLNGRGYPLGLQGDEIPKEARVLAVADTFDALTSERPYREAKSPTDACEMLERLAGVELDQEAVRALVRLHDSGYDFRLHMQELREGSFGVIEPRRRAG